MKKLAPKWLGPFLIAKHVNSLVYLISDFNGKILGKKHVSDLKLYVNRVSFKENDDVSEEINENTNVPQPVRRSGRTLHVPGKYKN